MLLLHSNRPILYCYLLLVPLLVTAWDDQPDVPFTDALHAPHSILDNEKLEVVVMHPDPENGFYRQRRFLAAGMVTRVRSETHSYISGPLAEGESAPASAHSMGLCDEFSKVIDIAPATEERGAHFLKIGVGSFFRDPESKAFYGHPIWETRATWETQIEKDAIHYRQSFSLPSGHGYILNKQVALDPEAPILRLHYRLENTGNQLLETEHYVHNWFRLDGKVSSAAIALELPYAIRPNSRKIKLRGGARITENSLHFDRTKKATASTTWIDLEPVEDKALNFSRVTNTRTGASIETRGDWAPLQHKVYVSENGICPEHFIQIKLEPGQVVEWTVHYRFRSEESSSGCQM